MPFAYEEVNQVLRVAGEESTLVKMSLRIKPTGLTVGSNFDASATKSRAPGSVVFRSNNEEEN